MTELLEKAKMKKLLFLTITIISALFMVLPIYAAPSINISGEASASVCETVAFTVNLSGCEKGTSYGISVTHSDKLRLIKGIMARKDGMSIFDTSTKKGTFGYTGGVTDLNGKVVTLTFKGIEATDVPQEIKVQIIVRNSSKEIYNYTTVKAVTISDHTYGEAVQTKAPTCTEVGVKVSKCTKCNKEKTENIDATGHTIGDWTVIKEATCEEIGEQTKKCSNCSYEESQVIDAKGHSFSDSNVIKAPTCTESGLEGGKCVRCEKQATNVLDALGHKYGEFVVTKEPNEKETGIKTQTCIICREAKEEIIPAVVKPQTEEQTEVESTDSPKQDSDTPTATNNNVEPTPTDDNSKDSNNTVLIVLSTIVAAGVIAASVVLFIKRRK